MTPTAPPPMSPDPDDSSNPGSPLQDDPDESNDDLPTPRASQYGSLSFQPPTTGDGPVPDDDDDDDNDDDDEAEHLLAMNEDYFHPPLSPKLPPVKTPAQLLSLQTTASPSTATAGLQSKATIAISLPEGVYAHQQDGMSSGAGGSVTTAPSFSDSTSIKSFVPTISTNDNDVESMLGEILEESEARFGGVVVEELVDDETEDEDAASEDEEGLSDGSALLSIVHVSALTFYRGSPEPLACEAETLFHSFGRRKANLLSLWERNHRLQLCRRAPSNNILLCRLFRHSAVLRIGLSPLCRRLLRPHLPRRNLLDRRDTSTAPFTARRPVYSGSLYINIIPAQQGLFPALQL